MQKRHMELYGNLIAKYLCLIIIVRSRDLAFLLDLLFLTQSIMVKNTAVQCTTPLMVNGNVIVQGPKCDQLVVNATDNLVLPPEFQG